MEILVIFIIISILEKLFKTKKDQKNIQEARKKRIEDFSDLESGKSSKTQVERNSQSKKTKNLADKIREEIEKGYGDLERYMNPAESRKKDEKPIIEKPKDLKKDRRYLTDYDEPYETYTGKGTLEGREYKDRYVSEYERPYETYNGKGTLEGREYKARYASEYEKPYETHGRKTGSQEGKTYKKMDEEFYKRREKVNPLVDKESGVTMQQQVLTGIIYSEILGKPKSLQKR